MIHYVAVGLQIIGATWLSLRVETSWISYWVMAVGSLVMIYIWETESQRPHVFMWCIFLVINMIGIARYTPWN